VGVATTLKDAVAVAVSYVEYPARLAEIVQVPVVSEVIVSPDTVQTVEVEEE
jgi:hypothetical protein